jgi:uncharacterized membrane protein YfcA
MEGFYFLVFGIFFVISFVFSMLGMGGSQLYIPILYWLGMDFKSQAIPLGLLLNLCVQLSAFTTYSRKRLVRFKIALPFALMMVVCAPLGALLNFRLPVKPVILLFAVFTLSAAVLVLTGWKPKERSLSRKGEMIITVMVGCVLGFLVGLIGRGGGSFVVPTLLILGLDPKNAAATSTFIVGFSSAAGFVTHLFEAKLNFWITLLTIISVISGSQLGSHLMATKLESKTIKMVFGIVLIFVATLLFKDVFLR